MSDRISEKTVTIRKPRECFGCCWVLIKGDEAYIQTNADNGRIYDITLCMRCREITSKMSPDDEFGEGDLEDE